MRNGPRKISGKSAKKLQALGLAATLSPLVFLAVQLTAESALYGLPLLFPIALLSILHETSVTCSATAAACAVLLYGMLDGLINPPGRIIPRAFLLVSLIAMTACSVLGGLLAKRLREQRRRFSEQSDLERYIADINTLLLTATNTEQLYRLTLYHLHNITGCPGAFFIREDEDALRHAASYPGGLILFPTEHEAAAEAFSRGERTGFGTRYCPNSSFCYLPMRSSETAWGVVGLLMDPEKPLEAPMLHMLRQILVRVVIVLEKQMLAKKHQQALLEGEVEKMRSDFLRAISHDFRTPLTGIICACSTLREESMALDAAAERRMIDSIGEEAEWLLHMVENLLSVTRVGESGPKLNRALEPVEELLSAAAAKTKARFPQIDLTLNLPDEFLMIPVDPVLIVQVLMNLIENAVKYAPQDKRVDLTVTSLADAVRFTVRDYGEGILKQDADKLFTPSSKPVKAGDSRNGMGLGLSICRSVIRAHGGEIWADNCPDGGASFSFALPKEA